MNPTTDIGCGSLESFTELSENILNSFDKKLADLSPDKCIPFHNAARDLGVELTTIYRMMAICARRQESIDAAAKIWRFMKTTCDQFLVRMGALCDEHPSCGADIYRDQILDLRNKCGRMESLHSG